MVHKLWAVSIESDFPFQPVEMQIQRTALLDCPE